MSITYTQIKSFIGKRVNIKMVDDSVIVNVKIKRYIMEQKKAKIIIQRNKTEETIQVNEIKEITPINVMSY